MKFKLGYITGLNGLKSEGLSKYLKERYYAEVIALDDVFQKMTFNEQVETISTSFKQCTHVIANSFGAYLFLNSILVKNYNNPKVLLLSPILGPVFIKGGGRIPKCYSRFKKNILNISNPGITELDIVYGEKDDHFSLKGLELIQGAEIKINPIKLPKQGHRIDHLIVRKVISGFLKEP